MTTRFSSVNDKVNGERMTKLKSFGDAAKDGIHPRRLDVSGVKLTDFLEAKHHRACSNNSYYRSWSKNMDYENWYIQNLIGKGAYANVYFVKHIETDDETAQLRTKAYAMKSINKLKVTDRKYIEGTMNERCILLKL